MPYRRSNIAGAPHFITVNLAERRFSTLINKINVLRDAFRSVKSRHTFEIDAMRTNKKLEREYVYKEIK